MIHCVPDHWHYLQACCGVYLASTQHLTSRGIYCTPALRIHSYTSTYSHYCLCTSTGLKQQQPGDSTLSRLLMVSRLRAGRGSLVTRACRASDSIFRGGVHALPALSLPLVAAQKAATAFSQFTATQKQLSVLTSTCVGVDRQRGSLRDGNRVRAGPMICFV